ncbi:uncharacterized protein LOC105663654 isoform X1 [Megachile rotundata]|uniref:uncharacterized protein LOC105663654 isoform X1 n=1 Tax=Megachile rotundata TaxID=143995 RepID=UPI003FD0A0F5
MSLLPLFCENFPTYTKDYFDSNVKVLWYNPEFSQSRYPPGQKVSKACTLICLLVAQLISQTELLVDDIERCHKIISIIAEAMIKGNAIHTWSIEEGLISHPYLSTEEALKIGGRNLYLLREWTFQVFYERIEKGLFLHISRFLHKWYKLAKSKNLFMLLITCGRTVLFIFQEETYMVTFFDSHSHNAVTNPRRGLVIAQTSIDQLEHLCHWYIEDVLNNCYNAEADQYELAFLYPYNASCCGCNSLCNCGNCYEKHNNRLIE